MSEDNKYSYIFTSDKLLKILEKGSEIFVDGTFSVSITRFYFYETLLYWTIKQS